MGRRAQAPLTTEESSSLIPALATRHTRVYVAARLMLQCGLRINEARNVRWSWLNDLHTDGATITVPAEATKTRWPRTLPIPRDLRLYLLWLEKNQNINVPLTPPDSWPLVLNHWGAPPSRRYIQRTIKETALTTINRPIRPHLLRHTFATRLLAKSNLKVVQQALGHRSIRSTEQYLHVNLQDLRDAMENTNEDFSPPEMDARNEPPIIPSA